VLKPGSNIVDESEGSLELSIEEVPKEQSQEVDIILEDFQDKLPKDFPDDLPPDPYPTLELVSSQDLIRYSYQEFIPFLKDPALAMTKFSFLQVDLMSPIDQCSNLKVLPINQGLLHAFSGLSQDSDSYFLTYPKASNVSQTFQLHFVEVVWLHQFFEYVRFAIYFWKTLWHLLRVHCKYSCAHHTRVKPKESIVS